MRVFIVLLFLLATISLAYSLRLRPKHKRKKCVMFHQSDTMIGTVDCTFVHFENTHDDKVRKVPPKLTLHVYAKGRNMKIYKMKPKAMKLKNAIEKSNSKSAPINKSNLKSVFMDKRNLKSALEKNNMKRTLMEKRKVQRRFVMNGLNSNANGESHEFHFVLL